MKGKYLSPKADLTFKLVFAEHKDLMMSLLNALLPLAEDAPITFIEYETPEMAPEHKDGKNSIVDVRCRDARGRHFLVEMQMNWDEEFKKRVIMNASKAVMKQVGSAELYTLIQPVFSLNLLNAKMKGEAPTEFYHDYAILNVDHPECSLDYLRFVFVELPKFQPRNIMEKKMAVLWLRFLTEINEDTVEAPAELLENEEISKALSIVEKSAMSEAQLYAYERFWDAVNNEHVLMEGRYKDGIEKGIEKEKLEAARRMKSKNYPLEDIADITGLSTEEIEAL
ncbi:MAG: Rpn family recombination-promoting nuclease/putative transposase [Prevotella sp.]|nr:Rpn family recombination-promoting nuclease/putative transposase [Prevotella sp.]